MEKRHSNNAQLPLRKGPISPYRQPLGYVDLGQQSMVGSNQSLNYGPGTAELSWTAAGTGALFLKRVRAAMIEHRAESTEEITLHIP